MDEIGKRVSRMVSMNPTLEELEERLNSNALYYDRVGNQDMCTANLEVVCEPEGAR